MYHLRPLRDVIISSFFLFMVHGTMFAEKEENELQEHLSPEGQSKDLRNSSKEASVKARQDMSMAPFCHEIKVSSSTGVMTDPLYYSNISINKIHGFKIMNQ